ncbi:UNVERIFIED_CONTAM: Transposon Tf2-12 polyprotein [Sesamum radiatum]|uniref:Transposon Tf2-12 polyprotein n=1 Tax=Sesamum radiatum TaxID=300843 RepID=A0AAW2URN2_SESRA
MANVHGLHWLKQSATYQRLVNKMFKDLIESMMEMCVDDMLVKSRREEEHLKHLENAFAIMRTYGMKLSPMKCMFGVRSGKCLGYMVSEKGIEANPKKIEAIMQLGLPRMVKDVQKLIGKIALLNRFIARMLKWAVKLAEFDIEFQTRTAIKAQVFADFVVEIAAWHGGVKDLDVYTDSELVAMQIEGLYKAR